MEENPLGILLADEKEIDAQLLARLLRRFIMIGKESGKIIPRSDFASLPEKDKILVFLVARKAAVAIGVAAEEGATSIDISQGTGVNYNSVRGYLSQFLKENLVQVGNSKYFVPSHAIPQIEERVKRIGGDSNE